MGQLRGDVLVGVRSLFSTYFWPAMAGLMGAILIATLAPQPWGGSDETHLSEASTRPALNDPMAGPVSYANAVSRAAPSVVSVYITAPASQPDSPLLNDPFLNRFFNGNLNREEQRDFRTGAGILISNQGHILTNEHLIDSAEQIEVVSHDGRQATARVLGVDSETDLAVLQMDLTSIPPIQIADPDGVRVGDVVLAIGNPFGQGQTVTQGIVSATGRNLQSLYQFVNFLQTDAAINEGNSGGALIDVYGNLIGINTAVVNVSGAEGISFAIPADVAIGVAEQIITQGQVVRGWIGIQASELTQTSLESLNLADSLAMIITGVDEQGPASAAGIVPGDIITGINGAPLQHWQQAQDIISGTRPGDILTLEILRDSGRMPVRVRAGIRPGA